ncbi:MAG TPA: two-component regulator propeller domain-containing protein [Bacteroidia bacterium]|nr:two-component regulator propeller domain-containing protein [Bacteroidia bacterium]
MYKRLHIAILLACLAWFCLLPKPSQAQTFNFRSYSVEEGLTQSQVLAVFQDHNGLMWFGTNSGGVSSFDGSKFSTYTERNGLIHNIIYSICDDAQGNLVFGTYAGLSIFNGFGFRNFTDSNGLPHKRVYKVVRSPDNRIWIGTAKGVCYLENNKIVPFKQNETLNQSSVFAIYADSKGRIWFGTLNNGVFVLDHQELTQITKAQGLTDNFVRSIIEQKDGSMLIATNNGLNHLVNGKVDPSFVVPEGQISYTSSCYDKSGLIWLATASGAYKYTGTSFIRYTLKNGLGSNNLLCLLCDREGNLWFGTSGNGVSKLGAETFFNLNSNDSLTRDYVNSVFIDQAHNRWIGLQNSGVLKLNTANKVVAALVDDAKHPKQSLAGSNVNCMYETRDHKIWFGTSNGLSIYDGEKLTNYYTANGLKDEKIYALAKGLDDRIWIGTRNGLCFIPHPESITDPNPIQDFPDLNNLLEKDNKAVYSIYGDRKGTIWYGTGKGVIKNENGHLHVLSKKDHFCDKRVSCITEDEEGKIWFGTDEGLFVYDGTYFFKADESNGLSSNKIYVIIFDQKGFLWVGTNKGLDRLDAKKFRNERRVELKHYGKEEGFKGVECNVGACYKDEKGRIWFGTIKGVTVYDPALDKQNTVEPQTTVSHIRLFFQDVDFKPWSKGIDSLTKLPLQLVLPYNKNHLTFDFRGISLTIPSKVQYKFKLEGIDGDWVPATYKNEATYSSLPPGEYTLQLKASNNDGLWNKNPFEFHFRILPPWYQTWWFYTLSVLLILTGVYLFIRIRTAQLIKTQVMLETQVRERTSELREEKEKVEVINKEISAQKSIIETKNRDITDSIRYAKHIQEAILPQLETISQEFPQSFILYMPKDIVSGDFYWFAKRKNKKFLATADCTGHGVPGAFMSIIGNTILNEIVAEKEILEPGAILNELHAGIKNALKQSNADGERRDGMDIALCAIEEGTNILEYAGANRPLWIFRGGNPDNMEVVKPDKFPIGGLETEEKRRFTNIRLELGKGDMLYLSSDGYADQFGGKAGKKMMVKNFQKLLTEILHLPLSEQKEILRNHFINWKGDQEQVDDVLVIGFRF